MSYTIIFSQESIKFLDKTHPNEREIIVKKIFSIKDSPITHLKKLKNTKLWRLRVLKYRVIIELIIKGKTLYIVRIGKRKNVYD